MKAHINGVNIAYTDQGIGDPLVFVHAFPLSKRMWDPQVEAFSTQNRVITLDLRGHGESDTLLWNFTLEDYAKDIRELLVHLDIQRATFIGLSMGGYVLFEMTRLFPDMVSALVLADTRAQADTEEGKAGRLDMVQTALKEGPSAIADMMIPKLFAPDTIKHRKDLVESVRSIILGNPSAGVIVDLMAMANRLDSTSLLPHISCPTLLIVGEDDVPTPPAEAQFMQERMPLAQLTIIPKAGHLSNMEQLEVFNATLKDFFKSK